jgi:hypothetical protein
MQNNYDDDYEDFSKSSLDQLSIRLANITKEIANEQDAKRALVKSYNENIKHLKHKQNQLAKFISDNGKN